MSKFMDNLYKNSVWFIIALSLVAYFAYRTLSFNGDIGTTIRDWQTWVQVAFVIWINVNMVTGAFDSATNKGLMSEEFDMADKLNNKLITNVNNEMKDFRQYVKDLNKHELLTLQEDYLFKVGDKPLEELTEKERKEYDKLKPVNHNIYGFNLPLYYEMTKSGQISYQASVQKNEGKNKAKIRKVFTGAMFAGMTINMAFIVNNIGDAFASLLIISVGLMITFIMHYTPQLFKFQYEIPKRVMLKNTLYNSYVDFKNGKHILKRIEEEVEEEVKEEVEEVEETTIEPII